MDERWASDEIPPEIEYLLAQGSALGRCRIRIVSYSSLRPLRLADSCVILGFFRPVGVLILATTPFLVTKIAMYPWDFGPFGDIDPDLWGGHHHSTLYNVSVVQVVTDRDVFLVSCSFIYEILPRLELANPIYTEDHARRLRHKLRSQGVRTEPVYNALYGLFFTMHESGDSIEKFKVLLGKWLKSDLHSTGSVSSHRGGLSRCRDQFSTLASFSKSKQSSTIASALLMFFLGNQEYIIRRERSENFVEWGLAIMDIQGWIDQRDFIDCLRVLCSRYREMAGSIHGNIWNDRVEELFYMLQQVDPVVYEFMTRGRRSSRLALPPHRMYHSASPRRIKGAPLGILPVAPASPHALDFHHYPPVAMDLAGYGDTPYMHNQIKQLSSAVGQLKDGLNFVDEGLNDIHDQLHGYPNYV
ncbi:hypothetical protein BCR34DRAFT_582817 [Clohesyomyces aquaticus]|uniref:Uncharacterized protein n=1 Tax=Clohesyomyces aquaticus TaxID=1231657 RepID=A0A1Y2A7P8_9PLEO|nr:hypothetical protein BCR34DRAFT_582817 [Clohesyomyces aquaticus]